MNRRRVWVTLTVLAGLAYLSTGLLVVAQGEVGVVWRFGRTLPSPRLPGLHLGLPVGIDRVTRVRTDEVRRLAVGQADAPSSWDEPGAGEFLTGDLNLLRVGGTLQYRVDDPVSFARQVEGVEPILKRLSAASLSRALARQGIDATLHEGRAVAAREAEQSVDREARRYGLGVAVLTLSLTDARPPTEVAPDFAEAQSARSDHDRRVNEAKSYAATTLTEAKAKATVRVEQARAAADRTVALARARAARFVALVESTLPNRPLAVRRLYHDTLRELLPRVGRKLVLAPEEPVDLSVLGRGR
ncbi:MAG: protease modulator HflK [Isosphaeraceae bacterium]